MKIANVLLVMGTLLVGCTTIPDNISTKETVAAVRFTGDGSLNFGIFGYARLVEWESGKLIEPFHWSDGYSFFEIDGAKSYKISDVSFWLNGQIPVRLAVEPGSEILTPKTGSFHYLGTYHLQIDLSPLNSSFSLEVNSQTSKEDFDRMKNELLDTKGKLFEFEVKEVFTKNARY